MAQFSEVLRIEAAIRNQSVKELEWALWYCRMRQAVPSARPADLRYWSGVEEKVSAVLAPPVEMKAYPAKKKKKRVGRGLGMGPLGDGSES
jgi:hypothetical protein